MSATLPTTVVVPTIGRPSLDVLLVALGRMREPRPEAVVVVDDRPDATGAVTDRPGLVVARSGGRGPAAARNLGWRLARTPWVSFLDDDVVPEPDWAERLAADLVRAPANVAGLQAALTVPLPPGRRPTDAERSTAGLATAAWITADMTYRRSALAGVGGFDERFGRAYREDAELALRVLERGWRLGRGDRRSRHPVRPARWWASVRAQAGNADDMLMRRLHGPAWRRRADAPSGRRPVHLVITAAAVAGPVLAAGGMRRPAMVAAATWLAGTVEFAVRRIAPGPRDSDEVARMAVTSVAIPPVAAWHTARGWLRHRHAGRWRGLPDLVLFDRDGTLVHDVPYNGDPRRVNPVPTAAPALRRLRSAGIRIGVVTNQSGVAAGRIAPADVARVNREVERRLGPFDVWRVCPHGPADGCNCRKPAPGMVKSACADVGVEPARCVVIGDIGADVAAAHAAGAAAILVPTPATSPAEVASAKRTAPDLARAVDQLLAGAW